MTNCRTNDDDEPELLRAFNESKSSVPNELNDTNTTETTSPINANGTEKSRYWVKDESVYNYPRLLLERIVQTKRQNRALENELRALRNLYSTMNKEEVERRLQSAVIVSETIEIS